MAFLSLFDDREEPKGSRAPVGFEMIWIWFGRKFIGNTAFVQTHSALDKALAQLIK